jgi:serine/threonine protein phosphatase PrpC
MRLMPHQLVSFGISDIGLVRQNNEDVWAELPSHHFYLLTDGMGGHRAGEVAAKEAADSLCRSMDEFFANSEKELSVEELCNGLREAILKANRWVYQLAEHNESFEGMGTTLCCFLLYNKTLIYAHVGDSRIYRLRQTLQQLTRDHSLKRELIESLDGHQENREPHSLFKNFITRAIGTSQLLEPEIAYTKVEEGDLYFLCSDGLTDAVSDAEISATIQESSSVRESCERLIEQAKSNGSTDNITIVMIKIL